MNKIRFEYIDFLKGFGIFLVVLGHATIPRSPYIYSFHVPLFFFLSGYLYKNRSVADNFVSKLKKIYFPFVLFNIITWIFFAAVDLIKGVPVTIENYSHLYKTMIGFESNIVQNGPLWFLLCLFTVSIIYNLIGLCKKELIRHIIVLGLAVIGYYISEKYVDLPFKFDTALIILPFFHAGYLFKKYDLFEKIRNLKFKLFMILILDFAFIHYLCVYYNIVLFDIQRISVVENSYGNVYLFYFGALSAILYISLISVKVNSVSVFNYLGRNSLIILCVHYPILQYVERIHPAFLGSSIFFDSISSIITVALCIPIIYISSKITLGRSC